MYATDLIDLNLLRILLLALRAARASHERAELRCHEPSRAGARGLARSWLGSAKVFDDEPSRAKGWLGSFPTSDSRLGSLDSLSILIMLELQFLAGLISSMIRFNIYQLSLFIIKAYM